MKDSATTPSLFDGIAKPLAVSYRYLKHGTQVERQVQRRDGRIVKSSHIVPRTSTASDSHCDFELAWLQATRPPARRFGGSVVRAADLFCGAGGFALGLNEAARALGREVHHVLASDCGADQRQTFTTNFRPDIFLSVPIERVINGRLGARLTASERKVRKQVGSLTLTTGGPPCQGHSNLNNHTRRNDPKNALYARMARFAEALEPESLVIENVPGVLRDRSGVFGTTVDHLLGLGYSVDHRLIRMEQIGVPQRRHRVIVLATKRRRGAAAVLQSLEENFATPSRPVGWAISDLIGANPGDPLNQPSASNSMNQRRIDWLFDNNAHDLPDRLRPACHRLKEHTYGAVYGRLYWDQPAWTITTGFQSMGQGRFVHPLERRVLTPHEAARLQFMPDFMRFVYSSRASLATMIGNAVPPRLAYALALELLR